MGFVSFLDSEANEHISTTGAVDSALLILAALNVWNVLSDFTSTSRTLIYPVVLSHINVSHDDFN